MRSSLWRAIALTLLAAATLFVLSARWLEVPRATFGFQRQIEGPGDIVMAVDHHSAAWRAGVRPGMRLRVLASTTAEMIRDEAPISGSKMRVRLQNGRVVTLTAFDVGTNEMGAMGPVTTVLRLAFLLMAGLLAFRRADDRAVRYLVIFLGALGVGIAGNNNAFLSVAGTAFLTVGTSALLLAGLTAAAVFAAAFPDGRPDAFNRAAAAIGVAWYAVALVLLLVFSLWPASIGWPAWFQESAIIVPGSFLYSSVCALVLLVRGYRPAQGAERQRRLWILAIIAGGLTGPTATIAVAAFYQYVPWLDEISALSLGIIPIGLAYVILRHRVIDVGFVINRAVVFTVLSVIVVGIFVVVETLLGKYVEQTSHVTSVSVQLAVALVLGFSIRFIHERVDRTVDRVFFRRRHEAEAALRDLTHDAPYITDAHVLIERCVDAATTFGETGAGGVWLRSGDRYVHGGGALPAVPVSENDPGVLAMRARHVVVEPQRLGSALPGALAFPMVVRGEVVGMLICDAKRDGTRYTPDEIEALTALAASTGHAYDGLEVRRLREELGRLRSVPAAATGGGMGTF